MAKKTPQNIQNSVGPRRLSMSIDSFKFILFYSDLSDVGSYDLSVTLPVFFSVILQASVQRNYVFLFLLCLPLALRNLYRVGRP